jgi:hypothetical protein
MYRVRATQRLRQRLTGAADGGGEGTTVLGDWYATALFWKPQVALFVDEATLLPVLLPLAPARTLLSRFPAALHTTLQALETPRRFTDAEIAEMGSVVADKTASRSVVGSMNDFVFLAGRYHDTDPTDSLLAITLWLARTPCGPLFKRHGSPDRELRALITDRLP